MNYYFEGVLGCDVTEAIISPAVADKKSEFTVQGDAAGTPIALNIGATRVNVNVNSPDGSNEKVSK